MNNVLIENVEGYIYVGHSNSLKEKNRDKERQRRIMAGWAAYTKQAQTKMERSMLTITYKDRRTNIWFRERTKFLHIICQMKKLKWHINCLKDDRWSSRVTTWRPYDKKRRQGRPAKLWRDDLDKYERQDLAGVHHKTS